MGYSFFRFFRNCAVILAALLCFAPSAVAHDPRAAAAGSTTVTFGFTDGAPMAFAPARIYGPNDSIPYLEATTDRAGRVSFLPDRNGTWRAEASDGQGHDLTITMSIAGGVPIGSGKGIPDGLVALSIVLNLVLGSVALGRWRRKASSQQ